MAAPTANLSAKELGGIGRLVRRIGARRHSLDERENEVHSACFTINILLILSFPPPSEGGKRADGA